MAEPAAEPSAMSGGKKKEIYTYEAPWLIYGEAARAASRLSCALATELESCPSSAVSSPQTHSARCHCLAQG